MGSSDSEVDALAQAMKDLSPEELAIFHRATVSLLSVSGTADVGRRLVEEAVSLLEASFGYLLITTPSGPRIAARKGLVAPRDSDATAERVAEAREGKVVTAGPELGRSLAGEDPAPRSLVYVPVLAVDRLVGVLCVGAYRKELGTRELRTLGLLGPPAGLVLERARLLEESRRLSSKHELVVELQQLLSRGPLADTFPQFAAALRERLPFDLALLLVHEAGAGELSIFESWGLGDEEDWKDKRLRADSSLHADSLASRAPSVVGQLKGDSDTEDERWLRAAGLRSGLVVPLVSSDASVGVFSVWDGSAEAFGAAELDIVEALGQPVAQAVENYRLFRRIEQAKQEWEATFDAMHDSVCIVDSGGRVRRSNAAFARALGRKPPEILGAPLAELLGVKGDALDFLPEEGQRLYRDVRGTPLGGLAEVVGTRLSGVGWGGSGTVFVARDVTETRELSERSKEADRFSGLGHLAAAVAHEVNNPLSYLLTNLHRLAVHGEAISGMISRAASGELGDASRDLVEDQALRTAGEELTALASESLDGVDRLRSITEKLRLFTTADGRDRARASLPELVDFCITLGWARIRTRAQLVCEHGDVPPVTADIVRLAQSIVDLLAAAAESLDPAHAETNVVEVRTSFQRGRYSISVVARGSADPTSAVLAEVSRSRGPGDRRGLSVINAIESVESLGGNVDLDRDESGGLAMTIGLPAVPLHRSSSVPPAEVASRAIPQRRGRILVIDDEVYVRRAVARILGGDHEVELASGGAAALDAIGAAAHFDVILCDVVMPGMSGLAFHEALAERRPDLEDAIIFVTGGVFSPEAEKALSVGANPVLRKPVQPAELQEVVANVMARRDRASGAA